MPSQTQLNAHRIIKCSFDQLGKAYLLKKCGWSKTLIRLLLQTLFPVDIHLVQAGEMIGFLTDLGWLNGNDNNAGIVGSEFISHPMLHQWCWMWIEHGRVQLCWIWTQAGMYHVHPRLSFLMYGLIVPALTWAFLAISRRNDDLHTSFYHRSKAITFFPTDCGSKITHLFLFIQPALKVGVQLGFPMLKYMFHDASA